jgi:hypothetical protein
MGASGFGRFNTPYAYGELEHELNEFFSHWLRVSHDNELGINAANLKARTPPYADLEGNETSKLALFGLQLL